jgi:hypothetical protein
MKNNKSVREKDNNNGRLAEDLSRHVTKEDRYSSGQ